MAERPERPTFLSVNPTSSSETNAAQNLALSTRYIADAIMYFAEVLSSTLVDPSRRL